MIYMYIYIYIYIHTYIYIYIISAPPLFLLSYDLIREMGGAPRNSDSQEPLSGVHCQTIRMPLHRRIGWEKHVEECRPIGKTYNCLRKKKHNSKTIKKIIKTCQKETQTFGGERKGNKTTKPRNNYFSQEHLPFLWPHRAREARTTRTGSKLRPVTYYNITYNIIYDTILYSTLLYSTLLYSTLLYYTIQYHIILYYTTIYLIQRGPWRASSAPPRSRRRPPGAKIDIM